MWGEGRREGRCATRFLHVFRKNILRFAQYSVKIDNTKHQRTAIKGIILPILIKIYGKTMAE